MSIILVAILIILALLFSFHKGTGIRESLIKSYVFLLFLITVATEIASQFDALNFQIISLFWIAVTSISLFILIIVLKFNHDKFKLRESLNAIADIGALERIILVLIFFILATTLLIALVAPPNTWDSMTYHMARVANWIHLESVHFYPTSIDGQNYQMPLAEFAILQLQLLSNSDRFANMVQWLSFCISILFASLIAKELNGSKLAQIFSAFFVATIPMVILQSSSTQNDLVVGTLCMGFGYFLIKVTRTLSYQDGIFCGLALGLALLTKGSAYIYCFSLGVTIGFSRLILDRSKLISMEFIRLIAIIALICVIINAGHLSRNYALYGNPLGNETTNYFNSTISPGGIFSNLVRNAGLHLGSFSGQMNGIIYKGFQTLLGDQLNNPSTTWMGRQFEIRYTINEGVAGNLPHFVLLGLTFLLIPWVKLKNKRLVYIFAGSLIIAIFLYSVVLKWQPWGSRLQTPIFLLAAPLVAVVFTGFRAYRKAIIISCVFILSLYSTLYLFLHNYRPLIPVRGYSVLNTNRLIQYFVGQPSLYEDYYDAVRIALDDGEDEIGLYLGNSGWEYPLWVLVQSNSANVNPRFRHVGVTNKSKSLVKMDLDPPTLILATTDVEGNSIEGYEYYVIFESPSIQVLKLVDGE